MGKYFNLLPTMVAMLSFVFLLSVREPPDRILPGPCARAADTEGTEKTANSAGHLAESLSAGSSSTLVKS